MKQLVVAMTLSLFCSGASISQTSSPKVSWLDGHHLVDLTHTLDASFPYIPVPGVTFPFQMQPIAELDQNGVAANAWRIHEHLGTQIDAPNHFAPGGVGLDALAVGEIIVPVVVIDFRAEAARDRDAVLTVGHIITWEARHGRVPEGAVVALYTGWDSRIGDASYIGLDAKGVKHFPGIGAPAALFLADQRRAWGVAVDTISFDPGPDGTYAAHRALLGRGRWALEAVANLGRLPPTGATLFIGAPRVRDATGGPVRVVALISGRAFAPAKLGGVWETTAPEPLGTGARASYLSRRFTFSGDRWEISFTLSQDAAGRRPQLRGRNGGRFRIGSPTVLGGAYEADFAFDARSLTPLTAETAAALTMAGCGGSAPWRIGETRSVVEAGCGSFRVPALASCPTEYDVIELKDRQLHLGTRPAAGDLCRPDRRPKRSGEAGLRRIGTAPD